MSGVENAELEEALRLAAHGDTDVWLARFMFPLGLSNGRIEGALQQTFSA